MKKLDLLKGVLVIVLGLWLIGLIGQFVYVLFYGGLTDYESYRFGYSTFVISITLSLLLLVVVYGVYLAICEISSNGYYNPFSSKRFKISGLLMITTQIMSVIFQLVNHSTKTLENTISILIMDVLLLMIGFGLLAIYELLNEGIILKEENELTI